MATDPRRHGSLRPHTPPPGEPVSPPSPRAVLFDMDGTLVDSHAAVERAWSAWAQEYAVSVLRTLEVAHGGSAEDTVRLLLPHLETEQVTTSAARQLWLQYDDVADVIAMPGALEVIDALQMQQVAWAVVTNADRRLARARLNAAHLEPALVVTVEDVTAGKPNPAGYLLAAARLGLQPELCLVVEDSVTGVHAGRAAGMPVAGLGDVPADLPLRDLFHLRDVLFPPGGPPMPGRFQGSKTAHRDSDGGLMRGSLPGRDTH